MLTTSRASGSFAPSRWGGWNSRLGLSAASTSSMAPTAVSIIRCLWMACAAPRRCLAAILRVSRKSWCTEASLAGLVLALADILPQASLCVGEQLSAAEIRERCWRHVRGSGSLRDVLANAAD